MPLAKHLCYPLSSASSIPTFKDRRGPEQGPCWEMVRWVGQG